MMVTMATTRCCTGALLPLLLLLLLGAVSATADTPSNPAAQSQKANVQETIENQRDVEFWEKLRQKEDTVPLEYIKDIVKEAEGDTQSSPVVSSSDASVSSPDDEQQQPDDRSSGSLPTERVQTDEGVEGGEKLPAVNSQSEPSKDSASGQSEPSKDSASGQSEPSKDSASSQSEPSKDSAPAQSESSKESQVNQSPPRNEQEGEEGAQAPLPHPTSSSNISASDVSAVLHNLTVATDGRQIKSGGSALTAALMIGGPMLAGALYAGANAPTEFVEEQTPATPNRRQDGGPGQDQEEDFNWQTLFQRTVGNIRNTASNVQDSVLGFFSPTDERSSRPSPPKTNLEGSLPPAPLGAAGGAARPKRRRKRPNAQAIDDEIRIQVPYVGGIPFFPQLGGDGQQVNPDAIHYLQQQQQQQQQQQHLQQQHQLILQQQQAHQEQPYQFIGQQPHILAGPPIPHDYPIDPTSGLLRQQSQGQQVIVGGHGLTHGLHPYNLHGVPGGHPIPAHVEDPNQHHLLASSGQPSVFQPGQGASPVHHSFDGQNYHHQSQAQQFIRDPSTGQIVDINSLTPRDTLDGVRRFDGRDREGVHSGGGLRRFDERQVRNPTSAAGASTLITGDSSASSSFGPLKISDALENEPPNRERVQIREQKELGIEGLESIPTVHVIKNTEALAPQPVGRKIQMGFDINKSPSENSRAGSRTTVPYVNKDGSIHFLDVPERYGEMRRLRRPTKGRQRRRKGGPGGNRVRNMKPRTKPENSDQLKLVEEPSTANRAGFSASDNFPAGPLKHRAFNHKYSTSSEERSIVREYKNPTDFKGVPRRHGNTQQQFFRGSFLGKPHSSSPFLGAGTVGEKKVPEVPEKVANFTTSFRVFDLENAHDLQKAKEPLGRITYTQIYGEVRPESVLTKTDLNFLKAIRPDLHFRDQKQILYQRPDLYGYGRPQQNNDDPHHSHDFHAGERNDDRFVIGGNMHRKITDPKTLPPSMLANEIEERSDTVKKEATLFRDDFAPSPDNVPVPGILSRNRNSGSREFNMGSEQMNGNSAINKLFRLASSHEENRRLDGQQNSEDSGVGVTSTGTEHNKRKYHDENPMGENRNQFSSSDSDTSNNQLDRHIQSDYEDGLNESRRTRVSSTQYAHEPSVERNFVNREYKTGNRRDGSRDSNSENLSSINLGELSPRSPLKFQPASFEMYKISSNDDTPTEKHDSQENEYYSSAPTNNQRAAPKPHNLFRDRKPPPPLPRPNFDIIDPNRRKTPAPARHTSTDYRGSERLTPAPARHTTTDYRGSERLTPAPARHTTTDYRGSERLTPAPARHTTIDYRGSERFGYKEPTRERGTKLRTEPEENGRVPSRREHENNPSRQTTPDGDAASHVNEREDGNRRRRPSTRESLRLQNNKGRRTLSAELDSYIRSKTRLPVEQAYEEEQFVEENSEPEIPSDTVGRERMNDRPNVSSRPTSSPSRRKITDVPQRMRPADLPRLDDTDGSFAFGANDKTNQDGNSSSGRDRTEDDNWKEQKNRRRKPGMRRRKRIRKPPRDDMSDVARVAEKRIRTNQMKIAQKIDEDQNNFQEDLRFGVNFDPFESVQENTREAMDASSSENRRRRGPNPDSGYSVRKKEVDRLEKPSPADPYKPSAEIDPTYDYSEEKLGKRQRRLPSRRISKTNSRGNIQYDKPYSHYPSGQDDMSNSPSNIRKRFSDYTPAERFRSVDGVVSAALDRQSPERFNSDHTFLTSDETGFSERLGYEDNYDTTVEFLKAKRDSIGQPSYFSPGQKPEIKPIPVSSFTSDDATVLPARFLDPTLRQSIREKIDKQEEPNIITIGDIRNKAAGFSNQHSFESIRTRRQPYSSEKEVGGYMKRIQDGISAENDPIISNLKAMFMENVPEGHKQIKSAFWKMGDSSPNQPAIGSFVDPSGRVNNPVRSFNLPTSKPFPQTLGPNFGFIENLERHHLTPQDLYEKDRNNFATVVMSSELNYGGGQSRGSSRVGSSVASDIVTGRISHNSRPRLPHPSQHRSNHQAMHPRGEPQYESLLNLLPQKLVAERPADGNTVTRKSSEMFTGKAISFETLKEPSHLINKFKASTKTGLVSGRNGDLKPSNEKTVFGLAGHNPEHTGFATIRNKEDITDSRITDSKSSLVAGQSKKFKLSQDISVVQTPNDSNGSPRRVLRVKKVRNISRRSSGEATSSVAHQAKPSLMSLFPFTISEPTSQTILIEQSSSAANTEETPISSGSSVHPQQEGSASELIGDIEKNTTENPLIHSEDATTPDKDHVESIPDHSSEQSTANPSEIETTHTKPIKEQSITTQSDNATEN